ncbi:MAG TPA: NlpC/P60 family protein [Mycobacterium sp.]|jgi:cell wall-associated NlpC family hydrolase|nr:NlpC/P60 family protein [Mycobacterium sp.]
MRRLNLLIAGPTLASVGLLAAVAVIAAPASMSAAQTPAAVANTCAVTADRRGVAETVDGVHLSADQVGNAQVIVGVVRARHLPERAAQIALMTAMQESSLTVLHRGDQAGPDSRGLFQQRDSWGPARVRLDPAGSTDLFVDRLVAVSGWQTKPPQQVAHEVQRNRDANDYVKWIRFSRELAASLDGHDPVQVQCLSDAVATGAAPRARTALRAAASMLGKPYCWDGGDVHGPTHGEGGSGCGPAVAGFDCSGLVLYAWAQVGIDLPHLASADTKVGRQIPLAQAQPGDLVFLANQPDGIHHVAMVWSITPGTATGAGQIIEAQDFNVPVHIRPWRGTAEPGALPFAVRLTG